jgi:hypothetical protein
MTPSPLLGTWATDPVDFGAMENTRLTFHKDGSGEFLAEYMVGEEKPAFRWEITGEKLILQLFEHVYEAKFGLNDTTLHDICGKAHPGYRQLSLEFAGRSVLPTEWYQNTIQGESTPCQRQK